MVANSCALATCVVILISGCANRSAVCIWDGHDDVCQYRVALEVPKTLNLTSWYLVMAKKHTQIHPHSISLLERSPAEEIKCVIRNKPGAGTMAEEKSHRPDCAGDHFRTRPTTAEGSNPQDGIYGDPEQVMLDELALSYGRRQPDPYPRATLCWSRRVRQTLPRRGISCVRPPRARSVDMIRVRWRLSRAWPRD